MGLKFSKSCSKNKYKSHSSCKKKKNWGRSHILNGDPPWRFLDMSACGGAAGQRRPHYIPDYLGPFLAPAASPLPSSCCWWRRCRWHSWPCGCAPVVLSAIHTSKPGYYFWKLGLYIIIWGNIPLIIIAHKRVAFHCVWLTGEWAAYWSQRSQFKISKHAFLHFCGILRAL